MLFIKSQSKRKILFVITAALFFLCACGDEDDPEMPGIIGEPSAESFENDMDPSGTDKGTSAEISEPETESSRSETESSDTAEVIIGEAESFSSGTESDSSSSSEEKESDPDLSSQAPAPADTTDTGNGRLSTLHVDGTYLVNEAGEHVQLYGMSTHGLSFFPEYVNYDAFKTLHDDWGTNCIRLAMYTAEYNGYCVSGNENKETLKTLIRNGVQYATDLDMYVIVDWHILSDQDPNVYKEDAKAFFTQMSEEFADYTNVLYEICNEPNGYATWESVKSYAEEIIPIIRQNDEDAVILIGSPTWSQDIDKALANPVNADNIMYTLHFYAGTHKEYLRERMENCINGGLPVFISEFGMCDASGNGGNDFDSAQKWMELIDKYDVSFMCWNLANKNETSSVIRSDVTKVSGWSEDELNDSGKWIRNVFRNK